MEASGDANRIRCFIALEIPVDTKHYLHKVSLNYQQDFNDEHLHWYQPDNVHITLKFLGSIDEELVPKIQQALELVVPNYKKMLLNISDVHLFPNSRRARVIAAQLDDNEQLQLLAEDIDSQMQHLEFAEEKRPFKSHITLARLNKCNPTLLKKLRHELDAHNQNNNHSKEFTASQVVIYKSDTLPTGPIYTPISTYQLK